MYKHTFYYFLGNKKYPEIYILQIQDGGGGHHFVKVFHKIPVFFKRWLPLVSLWSSDKLFRYSDFFSEKIIVGPHGVPDPPSLAQMTCTQCTSMSELKIDPGAPPGGQI